MEGEREAKAQVREKTGAVKGTGRGPAELGHRMCAALQTTGNVGWSETGRGCWGIDCYQIMDISMDWGRYQEKYHRCLPAFVFAFFGGGFV